MTAAVAVLYAREDSVYKQLGYADVWDAARDARRWPGGLPAVAHPPCRSWGRLRKFAKPREDERMLALLAVQQVRTYGGVLEHPAGSTLFDVCKLPKPGNPPDAFGGFTIELDQVHFGHRARKPTWLYVVRPTRRPKMHVGVRQPTATIRGGRPGLPQIGHREREATPERFARWLCLLAMSCTPLET